MLIIEYADISPQFIKSCIVYPGCASDVLTIYMGLQLDRSSSSLIVDVVARKAMNEFCGREIDIMMILEMLFVGFVFIVGYKQQSRAVSRSLQVLSSS